MKNMPLVAMVCLSLVLLSCASAQPPAPTVKEPPAAGVGSQGTVQQQGWEQDWQNTLAAAKKEGILTIYSGIGSELRQPISQAIKEKFGLDIDWVIGSAQSLTPKILAERRAGLYLADIIMGGVSQQIATLKPAGVLEPVRPLLVLPEILDAKAWYGEEPYWIDKEKSYIINFVITPQKVITINTDFVKPEEMTSYYNLHESRWKGKIVLEDPATAGQASRIFSAINLLLPDFWKGVAANDPVIIRNERMATDWVARGAYPILVGSRDDVIMEYIKAGAPLKRPIPREGTYLGGLAIPMSMLKQAPHPNASKVFINWYLSKDASTMISRLFNVQTAREDVPTDHLPPEVMRLPTARYVNFQTEENVLRQQSDYKLVMEIFGPLLK
ncbi:MAG: extracellular solute-binding protein [Chloroflexi bacterium]|nr:extracellular solute-binding protein [Chloroflexota bacterium]